MEPKQKILIVDDSEINRAMLKEILGEGYDIWKPRTACARSKFCADAPISRWCCWT